MDGVWCCDPRDAGVCDGVPNGLGSYNLSLDFGTLPTRRRFGSPRYESGDSWLKELLARAVLAS